MDEFKYTQNVFENPETLKRERRYAVLNAAAFIYAEHSYVRSVDPTTGYKDWRDLTPTEAVNEAEALLAEIERRET